MDLSIIIPAFNEGLKVARDVAAAASFLVSARLSGEIIVVDDGMPTRPPRPPKPFPCPPASSAASSVSPRTRAKAPPSAPA